MESANEIILLQLIISRLERIQVDSRLAHRAGGIRGSLLTMVENLEKQRRIAVPEMERLVNQGFQILEQAAAEKVHRGGVSKK